tara:strand:+ start:36 stop:908 length:873 start_codon:yes stop_codon:yes gene_type:complete
VNPYPCTLLIDNGSHRAESTLSLRRIAEALSAKLDGNVHPVSLLHSTKVDPAELGGTPAQIFEPFLRKQREKGQNSFLVVPFFFGHSAAIYEYLPQRVREMSKDWPELEVRIAPSMVKLDEPGDTRVAGILGDLVIRKIEEEGLVQPAVTLVDHGTPRTAVNKVRNHVAGQLAEVLKDYVSVVVASSMERREGDEYAFNEPLLENLLGQEKFEKDVVLSMLFISPGRHAGPGGDIAQIRHEAEKKSDGLRTFASSLFATHPGVVDLLAERYAEGLSGDPIAGEVPAPDTR